MRAMFYNATAYNQPLRSWVTAAVIDACLALRDSSQAFKQRLGRVEEDHVLQLRNGLCG